MHIHVLFKARCLCTEVVRSVFHTHKLKQTLPNPLIYIVQRSCRFSSGCVTPATNQFLFPAHLPFPQPPFPTPIPMNLLVLTLATCTSPIKNTSPATNPSPVHPQSHPLQHHLPILTPLPAIPYIKPKKSTHYCLAYLGWPFIFH